MTDFFSGEKPLSERDFFGIKNIQKSFLNNVFSDTNDSPVVTEQQRSKMSERDEKKKYATASYQLLPLSTGKCMTVRIGRITAYNLKPYCITFKIVQL